MIDTRAIRANAGSALKFRGKMSDCAPWLNIRLEIVAKDAMLSADEIDALRARLAAETAAGVEARDCISHMEEEIEGLEAALAAAEARADAEHARAERVAGQNARLLRYVLAVRRMKRCTAQELYAARLEEGNAYDALRPGDLGGDE